MNRYRPSNGTEGDIFMENWCCQCKHEQPDSNPCDILGAAGAYDINNSNYPKEWIYDNKGVPCCTAFEKIEKSDASIPRCEKTINMFGSGT